MSRVFFPIETQIEELLVNDGDFLRLEREFDQFCPFEALGMVRSEVRHGNFLAYILNPNRPHGFGSTVLRAFLLAVARGEAPARGDFQLKPLDVHLLDIQQAEVRREWRNIDLLIVIQSQKIVIPVELKIESTQGTDQLGRYRRIAESEWPVGGGWKHLNVFLTKYEEEPVDAHHWQPLAIEDLVKEIELVAQKNNTAPASESLNAYLRMLRRHHLDDARLEELARKLWSRHREALEFLVERQPDATGNLFDALKDRKADIAKALRQDGLGVVLDADYKTIIRFAFERWDALPGFKSSNWTESRRLILLELKRERTKINAYLYLGPSEEDYRKEYVALLGAARLHRPNARPGRDWMCLAKGEMLPDQIDDDTDLDMSIDIVSKNLQLFAAKVFHHFDPILAGLSLASGADK
ncbi:PD-(D/E)XK nuclease family protein [Rhizobium sp. CFBP 13717]|nr:MULTISPECIES: PD-(D/E)XK nuclease family protein [unclassified Rhizobium]MBD8689367.1 PD-(D/E)XK nuclease family protein [Rhizobium sp. CFBP 13644]MBD8693874.1 PD-(D/E)XK nuclease family protein [Rhizobium sp. CFBP 13717]